MDRPDSGSLAGRPRRDEGLRFVAVVVVVVGLVQGRKSDAVERLLLLLLHLLLLDHEAHDSGVHVTVLRG